MIGEKIIEFFRKKNPDIIVQAPSRVNLINPLDAVEADYWMPSVAINGIDDPLSAFCYFKEINGESVLKLYDFKNKDEAISIKISHQEKISKDILKFRSKFSTEYKLFYASVYRLNKTVPSFWTKFEKKCFEIGIITTIPRQSGLGGSAAIIIAILYGFSKFFNIYNTLTQENEDFFPINKDIIAEMATKVEDDDLKITAGYGDRYVISRGGLCFCSYFGKLHHKELSSEPLAVYDRIDKTYNIKKLPFIVCFSGVSHESGDVHKTLRKLYLHKDPEILKGYERLGEISWKSRFALMKQNWKKLGKYFQENTKIMNEIMKNAGFSHGIGLANNLLITLIEDHPDVYAIKLTGAGGGGSVFALVKPDKIDYVLNFWKDRLNEIIRNKEKYHEIFPSVEKDIREELKKAMFYKIRIHKGVHLITN